jgi:hypothetical protein
LLDSVWLISATPRDFNHLQGFPNPRHKPPLAWIQGVLRDRFDCSQNTLSQHF